jgi:hypothetical protein
MHDYSFNLQYIEFIILGGDGEVKAIQLRRTLHSYDANTSTCNFGILKMEIRFIRDTMQLSLYVFHINFDY